MENSLEHLTAEEQEALRTTFESQALELLDSINEGLLRLEAGHSETSLFQGLQRAVHTLKGDAGAFGLNALVQVAHRMEDLLVAVAEGRCPLERDRLTALFRAADACEHLLRGDGEGAVDVAGTLAALAPPRADAAGGTPTAGPEAHGGADDRGQGAPGSGAGPDVAPGGPPPATGGTGEGLDLTEYERLAAREAAARGLTLYVVRAAVDPGCRMVGAGAFLLLRHLQDAGEILRSDPPLSGPVPDGCTAFTILLASALGGESLERRCLLPGIVSAVRAAPYAIEDRGLRIADLGDEATEAAAAAPDLQSPAGGGPAAGTSTLLVETRRIDRAMNLVGELVIARSMFQQAFRDLQARFPKADFLEGFREAHRLMDRTLADLQKGVMKIRMVPIDRVFRRLPRLVRDLAGGGKTVRLALEGRATELDKGIVDALGEPLVHLIRNAVDHGIEPAAAREAAGKPPVGAVRVAARAEGNQIVIEVGDDGRGMDPEALRRAAVARGLLQAEAAKALSDAQALDLIFLPGFSTAAHITDISGRGVGMDAVRVSLEALKGQIQVASTAGQGTTFTLRVPLTLAIIRAMLFRVAGRLYALPLSTIAEIVRVEPGGVRTVDGLEVLRLRDRVVSLIRLRDVLAPGDPLRGAGCEVPSGDAASHDGRRPTADGPAGAAGGMGRLYVLVMGLAEQRIGLVVDGIHGEGELVIKALDADWVSRAPVAGAAILGDGRVILILDPGALIQRTRERGRASREAGR